MQLTMKINDGDRVLVCFKTMTDKEIRELEKWSLSVTYDTLSYFKLPLFAISRGDLCYDFGILDEEQVGTS